MISIQCAGSEALIDPIFLSKWCMNSSDFFHFCGNLTFLCIESCDCLLLRILRLEMVLKFLRFWHDKMWKCQTSLGEITEYFAPQKLIYLLANIKYRDVNRDPNNLNKITRHWQFCISSSCAGFLIGNLERSLFLLLLHF